LQKVPDISELEIVTQLLVSTGEECSPPKERGSQAKMGESPTFAFFNTRKQNSVSKYSAIEHFRLISFDLLPFTNHLLMTDKETLNTKSYFKK